MNVFVGFDAQMDLWFKCLFLGCAVLELVQLISYNIEIIGEGELQILVFAHLDKLLEEWINRHFLCPEFGAEENHRTCESKGLVMVLHSVLEDFLHCACTARSVNDATECDGKDEVFADAVLKELGDVGGERC